MKTKWITISTERSVSAVCRRRSTNTVRHSETAAPVAVTVVVVLTVVTAVPRIRASRSALLQEVYIK